MFKKMKHMKNEKGLTLIELLAVIVILAIIAAIAIPAIGSIINNTRDKAVLSDIQAAVSAAKIARADGTCSTSCNGSHIEFTSDKIANSTAVTSGGTTTGFTGENITITFDTNGTVNEISTTLAAAFSGTRIRDAVTGVASYSATAFTISGLTEVELNGILD